MQIASRVVAVCNNRSDMFEEDGVSKSAQVQVVPVQGGHCPQHEVPVTVNAIIKQRLR